MRGFSIFILIFGFLFLFPLQVHAEGNKKESFHIFQKKDYKQMFLNNALDAEKRGDKEAAFHSFEKALYYYNKDIVVLETYEKFCERQKYFEKAEELCQKLYILTINNYYLYKSQYFAIKNGKLSNSQLEKVVDNKYLSAEQKKQLYVELISHFSSSQDWKRVKNTCDKFPKKAMDKNIIVQCVAAMEKTKKEKGAIGYYLRYSELYPQNHGIKYHLAGLFEKQGDYPKAAKVYEGLMKSGDMSEHVKSSYEFVKSKSRSKPSKEKNKVFQSKVKPQAKVIASKKEEVLTEEQKKENQIYKALRDKNFKTALEITEELLQKTPEDKKLLVLALENSMATQNWDKALFYNDKLLEFEPASEVLLKNKGDLFSIKGRFSNAIEAYKKLVEIYPTLEYHILLANMYMAKREFLNAQAIYEPIYNEYPDNVEIAEALLNSLLAQQKLKQAYWVVIKSHLENTKSGHMVFGDMAILDKDYEQASKHYLCALEMAPNDLVLQNKLAQSYRMRGFINSPTKIYNNVLCQDPKNLEARLGLGYLEIEKKHFEKARNIFSCILKENPDYSPAQIAMAHSYLANDDKINAIEILDKIPQTNETKVMKSQTYYDMNMWSDALTVLNGVVTKDAEVLKYKIRKDEAITIIPTYSFFFQKLSDQFKLDYHKFGITASKNIDDNKNVFMSYNVIVYTSGGPNKLNNVVNEFIGGMQARPSEDFEYRTTLGVKAFEFGDGAMITTDSWIKRYFKDKFNAKLGFSRNNIEQSYLSAVGRPIDGVFTGRAADNKIYLELNTKLPYQMYAYAKGGYGVITAQNLVTNQYCEGLVGIGKVLYNNPRNKWIRTFSADIVSYNSAYQYNLLKIYDSTGQYFGGYFSPSYFNATTANFKLEGEREKWHLKYGIKAFGGIQTAISPDSTTPAWGVSPYLTYEINDNLSLNLAYNHFTFAENIYLK